MIENNVIAVIEAIEKMLPPLPPTNKSCPDRYAHQGHSWIKEGRDYVCCGHAFDYT